MGPEWVIASTDCGFPQGPFGCRGRPSIMCPKLRVLSEGGIGGSESNKRNEQTLGSYPLKPVCRPAPCSSDDR